jgi:hypothetical protein
MKQLLINSKTPMSLSAVVSWHLCLAVYQQLFHDIGVLLFIGSCFMTLVSSCLSAVVSWHLCLAIYQQLFHDISVLLLTTADKQQDTNVMKQLLINSKTTMSWHSCWSTARCHETTADKQQDTNVMLVFDYLSCQETFVFRTELSIAYQ